MEEHHTNPNHNAGICDIEGRPVVNVFPVNIKKINDILETDPIDEIANCSWNDEAQSNGNPLLPLSEFRQQVHNYDERQNGDDQKEIVSKCRRAVIAKAKRSSAVSHIGEVENIGNERKRFTQTKAGMY